MNRRQISYALAVALALTLLSIFFFDQPIAAFVQRVGGRSSVILQQGTSFLEVISGFPIAKYALTYALLTAGLVLSFWKSTRSVAWMLLFTGCAQFVTRIAAGTLKGVFERLRPFEVIERATGIGNLSAAATATRFLRATARISGVSFFRSHSSFRAIASRS